MKQKILAFCVAFCLVVAAQTALASATPTLSLISNGDGNTVQVNVTGDPSVSVILFYNTTAGLQLASIGTTGTGGSFSGSISTSGYGIVAGSAVYVRTNGINGPQSASVNWPNLSTSGNLSLSQTGVSLAVGQTTTITANNVIANTLYLSNNSNPAVANINISASQITVTAINLGSTVATLCASQSGTTVTNNSSVCVSVYITVTNGSAATQLSFSISNVTVSPGQSVPITVSGGTGAYTVLSNSNSSVIQSNISGNTVTLTTTATSGSAAITVCSSDLSSCGIINVTASSASSTPLSFSQTSPTLSLNQNLVVTVSGGNSSSYYLSNNSNTTAVTATLSGSNLSLTGNNAGTGTITVCSSSGSCGALNLTVNYTASGGTFTLSQSNVSLLVGQVLSVTASGGTSPYTVGGSTGGAFQVSLNSNVITITGVAAGSTTVNVCTAGGACLPLTITVNASGSGTPVGFSQNNLNLNIGGVTAVTLTGSGGYYVSQASNSAAASVQINGSTALVTTLAAGATNISVCESGGQCGVLFVTVTSGTSTVSLPTFSQVSPMLAIGQSLVDVVSGGSGSSYYIAANTAPTVVGVSLNNNQLTLTGLGTGISIVVICASANSCGSITVTVSGSAVPIPAPVTTPAPAAPAISGAYVNGQLIFENSTIYMVYQNTKIGFANSAAFTGLGFSFKNVTVATNSGLSVSPRVVITAAGAHPRGTWIISGAKVFWVTPEGNIPVPTWAIFTQSGGQANFIVKANSYDLARVTLSAMALNDSRLQP